MEVEYHPSMIMEDGGRVYSGDKTEIQRKGSQNSHDQKLQETEIFIVFKGFFRTLVRTTKKDSAIHGWVSPAGWTPTLLSIWQPGKGPSTRHGDMIH